jgi:hypothetical protein
MARIIDLIFLLALSFVSADVGIHNKLESISFDKNFDPSCNITMGDVTVFSCPSQYLVYSTQNFIKYGNKGTKARSGSNSLLAATKIVEKTGQGSVGILDPVLKVGTKMFSTG